jgi:4a-hydroxytetrahydrobiopterin dehydratase
MSTPEGWSEVDGALQREFRFPNFAEALAFVNRVGELAEAENHHPDIELGWGRVLLRDRDIAARSAALA